jgi:uncharacterized membrane protein YkvA (DUF1232 family)
MPTNLMAWKQKAQALKVETLALYFAYRDPRVPWYARVWIGVVIAYAFSPIDLIPDFIPVLGYLDDLVLIPLGVLLALKMIPMQVMAESRLRAQEHANEGKPHYKIMIGIILLIWVVAATGLAYLAFSLFP